MNRRVFLQTVAGASVSGAVVASVGVYDGDTHEIEVTTVPVRVGLQMPMRVVALGDIHFDPLYEEDYVARVVATVNRLKADLIVYTGDFISTRLDRTAVLADLLAKAQARLGTYTIAGNHEDWTNVGYVARVLDQHAGIRMLRNDLIALPDEDEVYLTGLDSFFAGYPNPSIIDRTPPESRHIVLAHEPDSFLTLDNRRIRLQISGHTHGGQVRLPLVGAVVLPAWGRDFQQGLYTRGGRQLYVNRGIGTLSVHMRINCRPEITVFELT